MDPEADVVGSDSHVSDAPLKGKRSNADEEATQPARKKPNRKPTTSQQQQQQTLTVLSDTQNGPRGNTKLQEQVNQLLSREGVSTDLEALPPLPRTRPPTRGQHKQQTHTRPHQMPSPLSPTTGVQQLLAAAAESGFASVSQQVLDLPAAAASEPQGRTAGRDAGCAGVAAALASLRSTSSGLEESAVAAAGLLALAAAAAGGNSPCSSPRVTTVPKQGDATQQQQAAAASEGSEGAEAAAHTLTDAFPSKPALEAVAAAFPPAAAGAAVAHRAFPAAPAPKAAAAPRPPGEPITADSLVVCDVGTFMGNRMFKTPFTSWASWLKGAGPGSDAVLQTSVSDLLPNFSPWHQHLRQQVASKSRGGPGLAAWTARGYMCYCKLVVEKLQQQQPDVDHKQLLRKATAATNEFEQMARHGRSFEASPPASPKASASSRGSKATAFKGKAAASRSRAAAAAAGGVRKPRPRRKSSGSTDGDHSDQEEASTEQQQLLPGGADGSMLAADPADAGGAHARLPPVARGSMLRPRRGAAAAAAGVTASSDSQGGMVYGLLEPLPDPQAAAGGGADAAGASTQPANTAEPAVLETSNPEQMLQTLRAYAAEVEAVANLASLDGVDTPSHTPSLGDEGATPSVGDEGVTPSLGDEGTPSPSTHQLPDGPVSTSAAMQAPSDAVQPPSDVMQPPSERPSEPPSEPPSDAVQPPSDVMQQPEDEQQQQVASAMGPEVQLCSAVEGVSGPSVVDAAAHAPAEPEVAAFEPPQAAAADECAMDTDCAAAAAAAAAAEECAMDCAAAAAAGEACDGHVISLADTEVTAGDMADAVVQQSVGDTAAAAMATAGEAPPPASPAASPAAAAGGSVGWVSLSALQQQLGGCDGGMQVLWDVAQARHGVDVSGADVDAADLLLSCTDPDTLQAYEQALEAAGDEGDAGEGEDAVQSQLYQTLEVVSGLLQLLQQPAVEQMLGEEQHRQRLEAVSAVYEGLHAAAGDSPTSSGPSGAEGPDDLYGEPSAALAMACNTAVAG